MARFNVPPGWEQPPEGYVPQGDWQPQPEWPAAPEDWPFWVDDFGFPTAAPAGAWTPDGPAPLPLSQPSASFPLSQPSAAVPQFQPSASYAQSQPSASFPQSQPSASFPQSQASAAYDPSSQPQTWASASAPTGATAAAPSPARRFGPKLWLPLAALVALLLLGLILFIVGQQQPALNASDMLRSYSSLQIGGHPVRNVHSSSSTSGSSRDDDSDNACGQLYAAATRPADFVVNGENQDDGGGFENIVSLRYRSTGEAEQAFEDLSRSLSTCKSSGSALQQKEHSGGYDHPRYVRFETERSDKSADGALTVVQWGNTISMISGPDHGVYGKVAADDIKRQFR